MQAAWLENQILSLRPDFSLPEQPGEALVYVRLAGICATDLEMVRGYYPFTGVPGHEFVGEIARLPAGDASSLQIGQRVVGEINAACGTCSTCQAGRPTHCERRTVLGILNRHGTFAEYLSLPVENLHPVPPSVPDEAAVFTEPLAAALEIQQQVQIHPTDRVLLIGAGRLGQLIAQTLALTGCDLQVVARHPIQRQLLSDKQIHLVEPETIPERQMDVVVEATGSEDGFNLARRLVRPRGTIVMKSTYKGVLTVDFSSLVVDEITMVGSRCGPFDPALRLLESRQIDPSPLIVQEYPLEQVLQAYQHARQPGILKILLRP